MALHSCQKIAVISFSIFTARNAVYTSVFPSWYSRNAFYVVLVLRNHSLGRRDSSWLYVVTTELEESDPNVDRSAAPDGAGAVISKRKKILMW